MRGPRIPILVGISVAVGAAACSSSSKAGYVVVTVDARPAVHDAASITVALANAGTTRMDTLMLNARAFPVTFSISAPGRTGDLSITVDASDQSGVVVGHGSAMTTVTASAAKIMLDSTDFVVNTDYAGDQFPSSDFEANGFQLAALADGTWTTAFRDGCPSDSCNLFARRFDRNGKPATTQAAAGTNAYTVTSRPTTLASTPAIASNQTSTVAVWDFFDPSPATTRGVACRSIDAAGGLGADQSPISPDAADVVSVASMSNNNFVATWKTVVTNPTGDLVDAIHMVTIKPDCTTLGAVQPVSLPATLTDIVHRGSVASSADRVLFAWITNGDLHTRMASNLGAFATADTSLIPHSATDEVAHARVAAVPGGGFALAVRWAAISGTGPGKIELFQVSASGALVGPPALVTDQSGSDFFSAESFGLASRPDGTVMVAWHVCDTNGEMCTLSGRILKSTGEPITDAFAIPTTTGGSQKRPSVVGLPDAFAVVWSDTSGKPPDTAGQAVRARIVYPPGS